MNTSFGRGDAEREGDRLYLAGLIQKAGYDLNAVEAWRLLNARREKLARKAAQALGKSAAEVEEAARTARLTVQTVRGDIRVLKTRAQVAGVGAMALKLDEHISAVRDEIEATYLLDEQIMADLERSRSQRWTRRVGKPDETNKTIQPVQVVSYAREDVASPAALYGRLQDNIRLRAELRARELMLLYALETAPPAEFDEVPTLAQSLSGLDDPEAARQAVLAGYERELRGLQAAARLPLAGDLMKLERDRLAVQEARLRAHREYMRRPEEEADGKHRTFELSFVEVLPRQLAATNGAEAPEAPEEE